MQATADRGHWNSKLGFVLAAAGSAIGLGNIWRFPYVTGENGGAAFVVVYLGCVLLVGLPLLIAEIALGRHTGKDPVGAFLFATPRTPFVVTGFICLACCFFVLSYYSVIAGWTVGYAIASLTGRPLEFSEFAASPLLVLPLLAGFLLVTVLIIRRGVERGIERWSKFLMPLLLVLTLVVIARSLTLEGAMAGVEYYLRPDFSKINGGVVLKALGQALFSLSVGWGLMITYGSYLPKSQNIPQSAGWIVGADTLVALLGGLMVFPAVFALGLQPDQGTALTFHTLPEVFSKMPGGAGVGAAFFLLLTVAALTSTISMLEVPVSYLVDEKRMSRNRAAWMVGAAAFLCGVPSALSNGAVDWLSNMEFAGATGFLGIMDTLFGTVAILLIALLTSLYVGWVWERSRGIGEVVQGSPGFTRPWFMGISAANVWIVFIRFVCPALITVVLLQLLGLKLF
jgi:neurotransmitter:Na+ symporter, NSS family